MRTFAVLSSALVVVSSLTAASPALQIPDIAQGVVDWASSQSSSSGSTKDVHASNSWTFVDCGEPDDVIQITSLRVSPDPPVPGQKMTVYADGVAKQRIEKGAFADVVVKLGLIKLIQKRFDVCDELENTNATLKCPIEAGEHQIVQVVDLPAEIPKAKFTVNAQAWTQPPSIPMACATIVMDFMNH